MSDVIDSYVAAVVSVVGSGTPPIGLHEPVFEGREWTYVKECLDTGWVSSAGKFVDRFETVLSEYTGANAVAVSNGTAALHVCLLLAGIKPGDEVLVPSLTFVATANAISYCSAIPHFVDISPETLGVSGPALENYLADIAVIRDNSCYNRVTGRPITALLLMHTLGFPAAIQELTVICDRYHIALIEDAAESLGSCYQGRHTGTFGFAGALSFNGNKVITTGAGGAVLTMDRELAKRVKHITTTAKVSHAWEFIHDQVGYNYRMPNLNAALGTAQLERLDAILSVKAELHRKYVAAFRDIPTASIFEGGCDGSPNYWLNLMLIQDAYLRDAVIGRLHAIGIQARPFWRPMHLLPMYQTCPRADLPVTDSIYQTGIQLPSGPGLPGGQEE